MKLELIISGFGGQGVLFAGNLIAQASMIANYNVTYLPVYGPEMRGGTCNCTVIISKKSIASPIVARPSFLIIMNYPSFIKFVPKLKKAGSAIINSDFVKPENIEDFEKLEKKYKFYFIPVSSLAESLNTPLLANLCAIGAFYQITKVFNRKQFEKALKEILSKGKAHLFEPNLKAFELGAQYIKKNYKI
ncbi:2-oxoacid:acceptor oxidoreductase family protein [Thermodesulfobacterium hydrogeniphilum]|uniref:2-oxoacid:acceptor oxidoreductase family protein n=1 Tax=Thermodesulfobacterium hydrogeniphilum TaxID=161156 RepID=UPI00056F5D53|nr:2-oxoacid:acceptor oxidoreductase family protein [Thermodesulfobacterium hydrogeniphilum]